MNRKVLASGVLSLFTFILMTTALDYCRPDPDRLLFKWANATSQGPQIKKPHHPCASLKDLYDVPAGFHSLESQVSNVLVKVLSPHQENYFKTDASAFNDLSPPLGHSPPSNVPIFLLHSILLI